MYLHFVTALQRIWLNIGTFKGKIPLNLLEFLNQRFKWLPIIARNHLQAYLKSVHFQRSPTNIYRYRDHFRNFFDSLGYFSARFFVRQFWVMLISHVTTKIWFMEVYIKALIPFVSKVLWYELNYFDYLWSVSSI